MYPGYISRLGRSMVRLVYGRNSHVKPEAGGSSNRNGLIETGDILLLSFVDLANIYSD